MPTKSMSISWRTRSCTRRCRYFTGAAPIFLLACGLTATGQPDTGTAPKDKQPASALTWHTDLAQAYEIARKNNSPILVRAGAEWCAWCKRIDAEIEAEPVKAELAKWTLVYIDVDSNPAEIHKLGIGPIPAFRVLTADGSRLGAIDGFLDSSKLLEWLKDQGGAGAELARELFDTKPPDVLGVVKLVREFKQRDSRRREAVIRRLAPHPSVAGASVLDAFERGDLHVRLAALELLTRWDAPITGLDPWRLDSITPERIETLKQWARDTEKVAKSKTQLAEEARLDTDRLLKAEGRTEQEAILRRLDLYGTTLLPDVYRLLSESSEESRPILTVLRYRLAASDHLRLNQSDMFFALASTDLSQRRSAIQALAKTAKETDGPLLLELFSSSDPIVRESSLRTLRKLGGARALDSLVTLLNDPDPNVRAAVLKQLAEEPPPKLVPALANFLDREKDLDLLVHAVRVLRSTRSAAAIKELLRMLSHESWRVRAEAAEAVGETLRGDFRYMASFSMRSMGPPEKISEDLRSEAYVALIRLLDDPDGFVVSRAVQGLARVPLVAAVEPLVRTIEIHPNLAVEVVKILADSEPLRKLALPYLETFTQHQTPEVRAAAITGICNIGLSEGAHEKLLGALSDEDRQVRLAAARGLLGMMNAAKPHGYAFMDQGTEVSASTFGKSVSLNDLAALGYLSLGKQAVETENVVGPPAPVPAESAESKDTDWLLKYRLGKVRPDWMEDAVTPLRSLLASDDPFERVYGGLPLVGLGHEEEALPVMMEALEQDRTVFPTVTQALAWLPWEKRRGVYQNLLSMNPSKNELTELAQGLAAIRDIRAAELLWALIVHPLADATLRRGIDLELRKLYFGEQMFNVNDALVSNKKTAVADAERMISNGANEQRRIALRLVLAVDKKRAHELANELMEKPEVLGTLLETALEVQFRSLPEQQAKELAVRMLSDKNAKAQRLALVFLAAGSTGFSELTDFDPIYVSEVFIQGMPYNEDEGNAPDLAKLPKGLTLEMLQKFFEQGSGEEAVYAAFLAVLLGDESKIDLVIEYWRSEGRKKDHWSRMVYQAIAATGDDRFASTLDEIYRSFPEDDYRLRDFYWTIRPMDGPNVRALRDKIRAEVGMENLR